MILFEYKCKKTDCGHYFEEFNTPDQSQDIKCPKCGSEVEHIISSQLFRLKGEGFTSGHGGRKLA